MRITIAIAGRLANVDDVARELYWEHVTARWPNFFRWARQCLGDDYSAEKATQDMLGAIKLGLPRKHARALIDEKGRARLYWASAELDKAIAEIRRSP